MGRPAVALCLLLFFSGVALAAVPSGKEIEVAFKKGQTAFSEKRLDEAASEFSAAADGLAAMKQADKALAVYGNVAIIRMQQERWQDALDIYAKALALPGKIPTDIMVRMTRNIVVCAEKLNNPTVKAEAIARMFDAKPPLSPEDTLNFLAMQGDAYRAAELYALACRAYEKALVEKALEAPQRMTLLTGLGLAQGNLGQYAKALASLDLAAKEAEKLKEPVPLVESASNTGILYWEMGQYDKAASFLQKALAHAKEFKLRRNEGVDSNNMGLVYKNAGKLNDATSYVDTALTIAREVKNRRDEAIALSNRALLSRMNGKNEDALKDYTEALAIYREVKFSEGEASTLMGLARLEMVTSKNYPSALEKLTQAVAIYEKLDNPGFLAEAYGQLGYLYQHVATPKRKTRDLVFEDTEATIVEMKPAEALAKSVEYYAKALPLAEKTGRKEMHWGALHGLAFAAKENGNLPRAEELYAKAITVVLSMKGTEENPDLLLDFLRDKDDLFAQAIDVCAKLYQQKKDPALLKKQMEYDEIYRNEVLRANMKMASLEYADPAKKALYADIVQLGASKKKAEAAAAAARASKSDAAKSESLIADKDASAVAREFEAKLALWKKQYPQDAVLFDSVATVDTVKLQGMLGPKQAIIQYLPLEDALIIMTITKESVEMTSVVVSYKDLAKLIRDEFIAKNIEGFGHGAEKLPTGEPNICFNNEGVCYEAMIVQLHQLYQYLYAPVAAKLKDKPDLYIITSKYLSYVPFTGLIVEKREAGSPHFLVEDKTITLSRLSFLQQSLGAPKKQQSGNDIIAIGDPKHDALEVVLARLEGANAEADRAAQAVAPPAVATVMKGEDAKKSAWLNKVKESPYSIFYFATHGVPYAEIQYDSARIRRGVKSALGKRDTVSGKPIGLLQSFLSFYDTTFQNKSHLNGFLFMAYPDGTESGILTLREILELPDAVFKNASLAVLSACNTAVSYSPKVVKNADVQGDLDSKEAAKELAAAGWSPGVDQVCLTDTFMKKNFRNVYGTLWFADDAASSFIMSNFMMNLKTHDPAKALREAQLKYLRNPPKRDEPTDYPLHPYFWACGNIFGQ